MDIKEEDNIYKEENNEINMLLIPINTKDEKYLLKIFPSKDNETINFKLEKEKIQTYYFFENYDLRDFRQKNKLFITDDSIPELFSHLKEIHKNCIINLEIRGSKIIIIFQSNIDSKFTLNFTLKKEIVSQNSLNPLLVEQIQENKSKIKLLKKQIAKLNKAIQIKTDLINDFNNNIANINNTINNINNINLNLNKDEEESNNNKEEEEEELSKEDNSPVQEKDQEENQEVKRYISNNRKKRNRKQNKKLKKAQLPNNNNNDKNINNQDNAIFCFENIEILGNKKVFEFLIIFNIITILIILCLLGNIYSIKSDLEYEKIIEDDFINKLAYYNSINDDNDDYEEINEYKSKKEYKNSLFENENQIFYFKREISKRSQNSIKDINLVLKFSSITEPHGFDNFYSNCKGIYENLLLMKNSRGKKFALYSRNLFEILHGKASHNFIETQNNFVLYSFRTNDIFEYSFKEIYEIYRAFVQCISKFFSNEKNINNNRRNDSTNKSRLSQIFGNLVDIEIYEVIYNE